MVLRHERLDRTQAVLVDDNNLARLDIANEFRAGNDVEGATFTGKEPGIAHLPDAKRAKTEGIAHADDLALAQQHEGKSALHLAQRLDEAAVTEGT